MKPTSTGAPPAPGRGLVRAWATAALVLAWAGGALMPAACHAQSAEPQPRVAYPMHSARINQMRATPDMMRLATVGQDKTLRIWRLADLQLLRTIHAPSDAGEEGALRAVALTPDGRQAWVGGWTGLSWSGRGQLYRFDITTGRLLQTLHGFPSLIESLAISHDGRRLAVGLGEQGGLRVLDLSTGQELLRDGDYRSRVSFVDFARDGTLASTSGDGCLRLYTPDHRLSFRAEYPVPEATSQRPACSGTPLGGVRFSPDGSRLAFGLQDRVELVVMDVATQRVVRSLSVSDPQQRSLCCPNWSPDGRHLYMHGGHVGSGATPLYRVELGNGVVQPLNIGRQRFTNVLPLPDGGLLLSTVAPSLTHLGADGRVLAEALPPNADMRFAWNQFRLSADAKRLVLPIGAGGQSLAFDLAATPDAAFRAASPADLAATQPPLRPEALKMQARMDDFGYQEPVRLGEHAVALKPFQSVHSWAASPDGSTVALGTQWSVLVTDAQGRPAWERALPAPAYQVAITANGHWVVVAVGDGTLRWFDRAGQERMGLFLHHSGRDWVAWRHDGYYASSPGGDAFIGWLVNRGDTQEPDFHRALQFERRLYRPDLLAQALGNPVRRSGDARALQATLRELSPPRVVIESLTASAEAGVMDLRVAVQSTGRPVRELGVYVDGVPVLPAASRRLTGPELAAAASGASGFERHLRIPISSSGGATAQVRVEAETDESIGLDETAPVALPKASPRRLGRLWVLAAGVHRFTHVREVEPLPFAPNDARALAATLVQQQGRAFTQVRAQVLSDLDLAKPTKPNILQGLAELAAVVGPDDTTLVFLASHGKTDAAEYYFLTQDSRLNDVVQVVEAQARGTLIAPGSAGSMLTGTELTRALRQLPGRRIVVLDTCESSAANGNANPHTLLKRSASAQVAVLSAATGIESSWDSMESEHGVFTNAILTSLAQTQTPLTLRGLFDALAPKVDAELARMRERVKDPETRAQLKQTPMLSALPTIEQVLIFQP